MRNKVTINDYEFAYEQRGSGEKLFLIHGSASDYRTWKNQIDDLSRDYHVIAYSRRYHWPNKPISVGTDYSMKEHVVDLKNIAMHFGSGPINLIGHSYGALIAIELACQYPELIRKMILAEPPAIRLFVSNIPQPGELLKLLISRPKTAISIIKLGAAGLGPATKAAQKGDMENAVQLFGKAALGKVTFDNMSLERKEQAFINLTAAELTGSGFLPIDSEKLNRIKIPTLVTTGELSPKVFSNLADRIEELIINLKRAEISNASHIMHEDNPKEFNSTILDFLNAE